MTDSETGAGRPWWADAVVYQVYVRSFQDSDGDGLGDLAGVIARLDHLVWLGVDALWLSPFYPSPLLDGGYDVADFCDVDPRFGDLAVFDRLVAEAHARGLRVILDFVPNHTSDRHPWFTESRSSRTSPKRDWYVWQDGRAGGPPTNWASMLDGPAWTHDPATGQYYYHAFLPEQPDLNWRNPAVRDAMHEALAFWLARGVDGVRVDAVPHLVEDDLLRDDLPEEVEAGAMPLQGGMRHVYTSDRPETHDAVAGLRAVVDRFPDRVLIGEVHLPTPLAMRYYGRGRPGLQMPFNFALIETDWDSRALAAAIDQYLNTLPAGAPPNWLVGNHDEIRVASRIGAAAARVAAMLVLTLGGTAVVYNGEELGLEEVAYGARDLREVPEMRHPAHALKYMPHRAPMPWDAGPQGGFTGARPWLALGSDNRTRNVTAQIGDPASILNLYRALLALRRTEPALRAGRHSPLLPQGDVLAFVRETGEARMLVALNIGARSTSFRLPGPGTVALSTHLDRVGDAVATDLSLRADEGLLVSLA